MSFHYPDGLTVEVRHVAGKGRAVVAVRDIPAGTVIERSPVLIIPHADRPQTDMSVIFTYVFMWEPHTTGQDLYRSKGRAAIALGLASLLNHSHQPNLEFERLFDTSELEIRTLRKVHSGEELTIDYQMDLWFIPA